MFYELVAVHFPLFYFSLLNFFIYSGLHEGRDCCLLRVAWACLPSNV